ncbi:hypothetical protein Kisp01_70400 [Kineosporia sp. NBRC 101677]|uniref:class II glutamine amidotransferase n=1 Tax=Kineosporia sp. NBRC 101677 TaxID=3032197 RepID=UPI0024A3664E|nr:class II glutamine amidotransferase [Kineosporia sp. NBRC 101677]GLY20026.1 hypothetical protein Kisp01_70400 [Kineosporia sp. NBRC 101677]
MGLLSYLPADALLNQDDLQRAAHRHRDGYGFAIATRERLIVRHNLSFAPLLRDFAVLRAEYVDAPALFHCRSATRGPVTLGNCHPFHLGGDRHTVIAHSGTLPRGLRRSRHDERSDTRIAAEGRLVRFGSMLNQGNRVRAERWMGPGNTMVVLTSNREAAHRGYLLNAGSGHWDTHTGTWHSGTSYLPEP